MLLLKESETFASPLKVAGRTAPEGAARPSVCGLSDYSEYATPVDREGVLRLPVQMGAGLPALH